MSKLTEKKEKFRNKYPIDYPTTFDGTFYGTSDGTSDRISDGTSDVDFSNEQQELYEQMYQDRFRLRTKEEAKESDMDYLEDDSSESVLKKKETMQVTTRTHKHNELVKKLTPEFFSPSISIRPIEGTVDIDMVETDPLTYIYNVGMDGYHINKYFNTKDVQYILTWFFQWVDINLYDAIRLYLTSKGVDFEAILKDKENCKKEIKNYLNKIRLIEKRIFNLLSMRSHKETKDIKSITDDIMHKCVEYIYKLLLTDTLICSIKLRNLEIDLISIKMLIKKYDIKIDKAIEDILKYNFREIYLYFSNISFTYFPTTNQLILEYIQIMDILDQYEFSWPVDKLKLFLNHYYPITKDKKKKKFDCPIKIDGEIYDRKIIDQIIEDSFDNVLTNTYIEQYLDEKEEEKD